MGVSNLADLPRGSDIFLDSNVFVYAFENKSKQCLDLISRCASQDVFGITTLEVISEVTHKLMMTDAVETGVISKGGANALKGKHESIRRFSRYWDRTSRIFDLNLLVLNSDEPRLHRAHRVRTTSGLLTNDSVMLATMQEYAITSIASRDSDFDHVEWLTVFKPTDLP